MRDGFWRRPGRRRADRDDPYEHFYASFYGLDEQQPNAVSASAARTTTALKAGLVALVAVVRRRGMLVLTFGLIGGLILVVGLMVSATRLGNDSAYKPSLVGTSGSPTNPLFPSDSSSTSTSTSSSSSSTSAATTSSGAQPGTPVYGGTTSYYVPPPVYGTTTYPVVQQTTSNAPPPPTHSSSSTPAPTHTTRPTPSPTHSTTSSAPPPPPPSTTSPLPTPTPTPSPSPTKKCTVPDPFHPGRCIVP
jgi:hypothetical protein